jgi:hypothetical protein
MRAAVKIACLAAALMCLLALAASSAYASTEEYSFVAEQYPVELEAITHNDGFEVTGGVGVCENATYTTGSITGPTTSLSVAATYSGCEGEIGGKIYKASVDMNGCTYNFHHFVFDEHQTAAGKVSVECQPGHEIEVKIPELNSSCVGRIPSQTELPGTTYTPATSATGWPTIRAAAVLTDVEYTSEDCPGIAKSSTESGAKPGRLEEGELSGEGASEEIKLTGVPLEAEVKGYKAGAAHEEANEIGIEGREDNAIASGGGQITGTVTSVLAAPVEGIRVTATGASETNSGFYGSTTSNAGGEYTVSGLPSGEYHVEFSTVHGSSPDYLTQYYSGKESFSGAEAVTVTAPATTGEVNAELQTPQTPGEITGTVTSAVTKAPIEHAEVDVYEAATRRFVIRSTTNTQGGYTVSGLAPGEYKVEFSPTGGLNYVAQFYNDKGSFAVAEAVQVSSGATTVGIDAALQESGEITGEVTTETGQGIGIIEVVVYEAGAAGKKVAEAQTHEGGGYTVTGLRAGEYVVEFYSGLPGSNGKNYATQYYPGQSARSSAHPVKVAEGATVSGVNAKLQSGGGISGTVRNTSAEPIGGVAVVVYDSEGGEVHTSYTEANGEYTVWGLASGQYKVQFLGARGYVAQYYKNASSLAGATQVTVKAGHEEATPEINAALMPATAPKEVKPPEVTGTLAVGQTLTCSSGDWTGAPTPEEFTYQWLKDGAKTIAGATEDTYKVTTADEGHTLLCDATARNSAGETSAESAATAPVPAIKPANTGRPFVSGTAAVGQTLTCSHGTWESLPTGYAYQWSEGTTPIALATGKTYEITSANEGQTLTCEVTAMNGAGPSVPEPSANSESVPALAVNTVAPEVTVQSGGAAFVGETLSCSSGTWKGTPAPTFTYKWLREGTPISGAESNTYTVTAADEGKSISCEVTARNTAGPSPKASANSKSVLSLPVGLENIGSGQGSAVTTDGALSVTGSGTGTVTVGEYASQPADTPALENSTGKWFDVFLEPGSSYKSLTITDCNLGTVATSLDWYDPQGGSGNGGWEAVANANETSSKGCITITISGSSTPTLTQLTGTVFGVVLTPPKSTPGPGASNSTTTSGGGSTATTASTATGSVSLSGSALSVQSGGRASVKLSCAGTATCTGKLTLTAKSTTGKGKKKRSETTTIGTATFSIPAGKTATATLTLTATGRTLLKSAHGKLGASLTILKSSPSPTSTQRKGVQLVQKAATKAKKPRK